MSKEKRIVELETPRIKGAMTEDMVSELHKCQYCHGRGEFFDVRHKTVNIIPCPVCHGKGFLDAHIHIEWVPTERGTENDW